MTTTYSTRCVAADLARRVLNAVLAVPAGRSEGMSTRRLHFALPYLRSGQHVLWSVPASLDAAHMTISRPAAVADLRGSVPTTRQQRKPKRGDKSQAVPKRRREAFASDRTTSCAAFGDASTTAPVFLRQQLNLTALRGQPPYGLSNTPHWKLEAMLRAASAPPSNAYNRCAVVGNAGSLLLGEAGAVTHTTLFSASIRRRGLPSWQSTSAAAPRCNLRYFRDTLSSTTHLGCVVMPTQLHVVSSAFFALALGARPDLRPSPSWSTTPGRAGYLPICEYQTWLGSCHYRLFGQRDDESFSSRE